jgi:hypothetical protein
MTACDLARHFGQEEVVAWLDAQATTTNAKKNRIKISVKEVLDDLRAGLDDKELMAKYSLSEKQLAVMYRKLAERGYLKGRDF